MDAAEMQKKRGRYRKANAPALSQVTLDEENSN
jgi:hypothetical protein